MTPLIRTTADYGSIVLPTRDDVERARATIGNRLPRTPLLSSRTIGARLKCELFQRTGSFKVRGALNKLSSMSDEEKQRGVIAISAGNHAQAVAFAAREEGIDALVVMWQGADESKVAATSVYLNIPDGVIVTDVAKTAAGTATTKMTGNRITSISWQIDVQPNKYVALPFTATNPDGAADLHWNLREHLADGSVVDWSDTPGSKEKGSVTKLSGPGGD